VREADQILVIDGGRVVERGRHAELLANDGLYADLYHTQFADQIEVADETDGDIEELGGEGFLVRFNRDDLGHGEVPALS